MQKGVQMLARCPESVETNVEQDINNLKEKWESVETKLSERKVCYIMNMGKCSKMHLRTLRFYSSLCRIVLNTLLWALESHRILSDW